jgi:hypothetical protein
VSGFGAGVGLFLLAPAALGASPAGPKRVLILNPFDRAVTSFKVIASALRIPGTPNLGGRVDLYEIPLDFARLAEWQGESFAGVIPGKSDPEPARGRSDTHRWRRGEVCHIEVE